MTRVAASLLTMLAALAWPAYGAEPSAAALVETMQKARLSEGFEARMNVAAIKPDGRRAMPLKIAVIGQIGKDRERLLIRGISPESVRNRRFAAGKTADGRIRAIEYGEQGSDGITETFPLARLFDSGLVIWDMFGPWWYWPKQELGGTERIAGRECTLVRSQTDTANSPIREVVSCVDKDARLSLRTQLFDRRHTLIRTISVERTTRLGSGATVAKKLLVTEADKAVTEIEVYSGDEEYLIGADIFNKLDQHIIDGK
ncbi:hypothetical protein FGKAn22_07630 [Ferrigenium kumadai]|uniref:Uncharacterized protein TP-0789 domain-containing protein n=1 Tax=Ferrigenium kumadai TaxID=1682490 RepID=A0AAN1SY09_9PROT|nr:outer membrane lipoprotein-sorting protein [Ferrigenium kumadai]BBI99070.1 hypothetical protein FGKAn22_07630 [Ferrigenium kumadai]